MVKYIHCQKTQHVLEIQFARPHKKNALTHSMYYETKVALEAALTEDSIHVVLFTAEGDFFTAGNDLTDFIEMNQAENADFVAFEFVKLLGNYAKPLVAAVTGSGYGVGTTMLLHCDLVYILDSAKLMTPFVNLGLVPEAGSSVLLTERIGHTRAFGMFVMGEGLSGKQAVELGIANQSFSSPDEVLAVARQKSQELANKPIQAVLQTKQLMRNTAMIANTIDKENVYFTERLQSEETKNIMQKFFDKK